MPIGGKQHFEEDENRSADLDLFASLLERYDYAFTLGDIVKGKVVSQESNGFLVDVNAKTTAYLPFKEIARRDDPEAEVMEIGSEFDFYILRIDEGEDVQITLSRRRVYTAQVWKQLEEMMKEEKVLECKVASVVKGGLLVDVMGLRGFVPSSHVRSRAPLDELVGQTLPMKIITLDQQRNNIILSHRKVLSEQMAEQRRELFDKIHQGEVIEGEVVRLTDFGAFIDLGGVDGLLPLSQMSWRWVEHPSDILKIGEKVKVEVIGVDPEKQRVSLSIKSQQADPWDEVAKVMGVGDEVEGTLTRIKHFGAFVEVFPGVEALLPIRDVHEYEQRTEEKLESGQKIKTFIVKFSPQERRISLSFTPLRIQKNVEDPVAQSSQ